MEQHLPQQPVLPTAPGMGPANLLGPQLRHFMVRTSSTALLQLEQGVVKQLQTTHLCHSQSRDGAGHCHANTQQEGEASAWGVLGNQDLQKGPNPSKFQEKLEFARRSQSFNAPRLSTGHGMRLRERADGSFQKP